MIKPNDFLMFEEVLVTPTDDPNDVVLEEFSGKVVGIRHDKYVMVKNFDGEIFDCKPEQVHKIK